jgi:cyclophilin family peptidyl-prolyl cis-trans isomerase
VVRLLFLCLACAVLIGACGGDDSSSSDTTTAKPDSGPQTLDASKTYVATVDTSKGSFQITLDAKRAPKTGGSFKSLADKGFYDKLTFHRIVPGFVIQGGDPNGDGTGGPGYTVQEAPPQDLKYTQGVVAMAKTGSEPPGTSGSQFFVVTAADAQLPPEYALLGRVTSGADVVSRIAAVKTDPSTEKPLKPVTIHTIKVTER